MPTTVIFWVVTQLSGMSVKQGYKLQTLGTLVDGYGNVVADLGHYETVVKELLQWGETKRHIAVQAFAVDLCGDSRDELVLYQPYNGQAILIFTQPDSNGKAKPYVHEKDAYNIRSYF